MHVSGTHFVARTYMHRVVAGAGEGGGAVISVRRILRW